MRFTVEQLLGRYLSLRPRSEQEVRRYLAQKSKKCQISSEEIEQLVLKYSDLGYINDEKFAESVSHSVVANKSKGKRWVQFKLKQAGVDPELVTRTLAAIDPEETRLAMQKRLSKYQRKWAVLDPRTKRSKAYSTLFQSGFSSSEIRPFLDEWDEKE